MEPLSAAAILQRVATLYADAQSYHDHGVVQTTFRKPQRSWLNETRFTTAFDRATSRFRFEFVVRSTRPKPDPDRGRRWIIWRSGERLEQRSPLETAPAPTFNLAIAAATGVSKGAAHHIPVLLMPEELSGRRLTAIDDHPARIDDATIPTGPCYCIQRALLAGAGSTTETLWIDQQSFLIRRFDKHTAKPDVIVDGVTGYDPQINMPLPADAMQWDVPAHAPSRAEPARARPSRLYLRN
jgi:hypothetical protein